MTFCYSTFYSRTRLLFKFHTVAVANEFVGSSLKVCNGLWFAARSVSSLSTEEDIENFSSQPVTPVELDYLLKLGKREEGLYPNNQRLISSARFLQRELPIRLAKRVKALQGLPFIVGVNPWIESVYALYKSAFETLLQFPEIHDDAEEEKFTKVLDDLVENFQDVIPRLAKGFKECSKYISKQDATKFLDRMIHARIGIRVLAEHHTALHEQHQDYVGIVNTNLQIAPMIQTISDHVQEICEVNYGACPDVTIDGHIRTVMAYIPVHIEYMMTELLKNSMRASVEHSQKISRLHHPPIQVTIGRGDNEVTIRIRDQGGGVPYSDLKTIFDYSYTTVPIYDDAEDVFGVQSRLDMQTGVGGPMAGLGFGLPMTRIYAKYFGGFLELRSIFGYGCDAFLSLPNICNAKTVRI